MEDRIRVHAHALKHGLSANEVAYAWMNSICCRKRQSNDDPPRWIAIGHLPDGRLAELVAAESADGVWVVFHAQTPPKKPIIEELGLRRKIHGFGQNS